LKGKFSEAESSNPRASLQADIKFGNQKLKMSDVRNLSDDADQVIDSLKGVDYGMQELDVLIELSRQLKQKREAMFPDTSAIL